MDKTTYSAASLAAALGVPRTTINDWLTRYENYIDSETIGKRKVYSADTLTVLQEVARLRDAGKSGAEIELLLADTHGVKPEIAEPKKVSESPADTPVGEAGADENAPQLPAIKEIERSAMELTAFIADLRNQQRRSVRRGWVISGLLVLIIAVLAAASAFLLQMLRTHHAERQAEYQSMIKNIEKLNSDFSAELQSIEQARQKERSIAEQNLTALKNELVDLQQARTAEAAQLTRQIAEDRAKLQAEMLRQEKVLTEKSAAEKEQLLKKMERDAQSANKQLQALRNELKNAGESLKQLNGKLQQISEERARAAAAEKAAAEKAAAEQSSAAAVPQTESK